jgi:outer membrane protein OmpA-like peptidoglycan-associated protein
MAAVPVGPTALRVTKPGFAPATDTVSLARQDTAQVNFALQPRAGTAALIERDLVETGRRILYNVRFAFDSAEIEPRFDETLQAALEVLTERMPETNFIIEGHTDAKGSADYNKVLSQRRAWSVRQWLIEHGVEADRLEARGRGEAQPIAPNETPAGRRENRRTEIVVVE